MMRFLTLLAPLSFVLGVACGDDGTGGSSSTGGEGATSSGGTGGGGASSGTPITIMNWNVHNFFNDKNDSAAPDEFVKTAAEYQEQLGAIADVIMELNPDIAILTEVENDDVLMALNAKMGNAYANAVLIEGNDPRGVDIAALSKVPLGKTVSHKTDMFVQEGTPAPTYTFARDCVEFHLNFAGRDIALLGVHYRSKGPPDDADKRLAEAQRSRAIADELMMANDQLGVVILGDFNDLTNSLPFKAVEGSSPVFTDAAASAPEADRWTFDFMGTKELIDHQMSNPVMTEWLDTSSVVIRHTNAVTTASDHAPMMATYHVK
jgi:predicted extracellular nuclease